MKYHLLHPGIRKLNAFAEGDRESAGRFTRRHLEKCAKCRDEIRFLRQLRLQTEKIELPSASQALLDRIEVGISRNGLILLPMADPEPRRDRPLVMTIAAAALVAFGVWGFWPTPTAQAGTQYGDLHLSPNYLGLDRTIVAEYRPGSILADAETVVLRARFRTANNPAYNSTRRQVSAAQLRRDRDGVYRGSFRVPDSAVYVAIAVEDPVGKRVDHNAWRLWEILQENSPGRPSFDALAQRANDLHGRSFEEALRTVQRSAVLYPDLPQGWSTVVFFERLMFGQAYADSASAGHRTRLYSFDRKHRPLRAVPFETMHGILSYATILYDTASPNVREIHGYWKQRAMSDPSSAFSARVLRAFLISDSAGKSPKRFLPVLDSLWNAEGSDLWWLPSNAWLLAQLAGDDATTMLWADRGAALTSDGSAYYYGPLLKKPGLVDTALSRLRGSLPRLYTRQDSLRPLERNVDEQARADQREASVILSLIGTTLLARGRVQEGIDALERASQGTWDVDVFRKNAEARLTAGDTAGSLRPLALVAADPETSPAYGDSVIKRLGKAIGRRAWTNLVDTAAAEMRRRVLRDAISLAYKSPVRVANAAGSQTSLAEIAKGRVTVVAFWSRFCGPSRLQQVPNLDRLAHKLKRYDIVLVPIADEPPSKDVTEFLRAQNVTTPVYFDQWGDAKRAFSQWGTPQYDIVDGEGRIRFAHTDQEHALTQAVALSRAKRADRQLPLLSRH